ncbi:MAG: UDP-N-acetylglucosamine 2-epimerase (non-hydrolyzing) [Candidatus Cloacimonetes bacterium]|nr:UDP-N-acetylglucosamine 2-epimerase (non-hydrolyzing) [Candidatus Cloacimonas sp.]MDD2249919.1 UDP-N-acetylglucosamine 2-epimerase (non-hydrolyzing) [Candidatus Cloacimonadota bacterium]MCK9158216.1 UDP-N-acetylglucosamine 2-epimerase (non-hydrolyzing) [Candidatus Cloacimonas sp.]MCK9164339.1 UDP-N-acetylglucosamine 2-epimerase (non-hydrolyzing) [Candidatus Cloacimonas sp.]MDD3868920.1 UDP-N-acetylglucosamine 2-epimerase (non-hydrolyzing) [Candidatus Cloacimonadota bacterium]
MKIAQIVGARPQFIKLAPLSRKIRQRHQEIIIHSGQHYDLQMNEVFFRDMEIPAPDYNLNVGSGSQATQTAAILTAIERILENEKPDLVIIYGDTNTTLAGALAAAKLNIKIAHIEACLRSFNKSMPEEVNRIVADHLSDILFAPTETAMQNAHKEGLLNKTFQVGDIMVDSLIFGIKKAEKESKVLSALQLEDENYCLLTLHRPYNVDNPDNLLHILSGLNTLQRKIIFPVHPRTRNILKKIKDNHYHHIHYIEPQAYLDFLLLMKNADMIFTDSGGIQKEAYILKKPCVTLRPETEWLETVQSGWNLLLPVASKDFPNEINKFTPPSEHPDLFGKDVAELILQTLETFL